MHNECKLHEADEVSIRFAAMVQSENKQINIFWNDNTGSVLLRVRILCSTYGACPYGAARAHEFEFEFEFVIKLNN